MATLNGKCCTHVVQHSKLEDMVHVKLVMHKVRRSNGTYPIVLRVTKERKSKYFRTSLFCVPEEWNPRGEQFNRYRHNCLNENRILLRFKERALEIATQLSLELGEFGLDDFETAFSEKRIKIGKGNFFGFWETLINDMSLAGKVSNARIHTESMKSLRKYHGSGHLRFEDIHVGFLNSYESFLRHRGGTDGGISVKMRCICKVFNQAIDQNMVGQDAYPFKKYKISKFKGKLLKSALSIDEVRRIENLYIPKEEVALNNFRDYFIFSFYTRGMNFADMMVLRWSDIHGEHIHYIRAKTKGRFSIKILPPIEKILLRFSEECNLGTPYVFPILLSEGLSPNQLENRKKKVLGQYNKALKKLATMAEIEKHITSYVARHSYATCLKFKGVSTDVISESLGHRDIKVTQTYLKEFGSEVLDEATELLLI